MWRCFIEPAANRRDSSRLYNKRSIADLYTLLPQINWLEFLTRLIPPMIGTFLSNSTTVIVQEVDYLKNLSDLLRITSKRVVSNYIFWRICHFWNDILDKSFDSVQLELMNVLNGQRKIVSRWQHCVQKCEELLPAAVSALFVRNHFDSNTKKEAMNLLTMIQKAFQGIVGKISWMDSDTKKFALQKASSIISKVGYDKMSMNDTALDGYYAKLDIASSDTYFEVLRKTAAWNGKKHFSRLNKPFNKYEFTQSASTLNAYFTHKMNSLCRAVNYGAIGFIMGHEMIHGFDDVGSAYDIDGNLHNWWSEESYQNFTNKTQCLIDQYGSYQVPNIDFKINGKLTLGENIADNGGIKQSYQAYQEFISQSNQSEPVLPGMLDYTSDQIFFLSYAQIYCGHGTKSAQIEGILTDDHSPQRYRVNGPLSNLAEFSEAFDCPLGSNLNPIKRCSIW
ncbi:unnamed protein product [Thelazia callipaeda]|uniref:Peptidase_M13 domain-containing protein n=1 Tax=Thelazia callipaeda TaxID=103827 RepID=A0A0N5CS86_THECL|nr:unnamed protein product [Thelazia callipaeda]